MIFLTGCDKNTEWQLPWFIHNFRTHSEATIHVADFGMTEEMSAFAHANFDAVHVLPEFESGGGWFNKIAAMMHMATYGEQPYCWLDTDCQVMRKPDGISRFIIARVSVSGLTEPIKRKAAFHVSIPPKTIRI